MDTGCGIPQEKPGVIFKWFEKADSYTQGAGLGLSICKFIIEQMNGTIEVVSVLGEGSTFTVTFPCRIQLVESKHTKQEIDIIDQKEFTLTPHRRGFHLITEETTRNLPSLSQTGILRLFVKHISAALTINENVGSDIQTDMEAIFNRLAGEREPYYQHTCEGDDDMPAHAKSTIAGTGLTIPVTNGWMDMDTWQGIYLCESRNRGGGRRIVATVIG